MNRTQEKKLKELAGELAKDITIEMTWGETANKPAEV